MSGNTDNYNSLITSLKRSAYPHLGQQKVIFLPEIHTAYPKTIPSPQSTVTVTTLDGSKTTGIGFQCSKTILGLDTGGSVMFKINVCSV